MYEQSGRYDDPLDATFKPPKTGLAAKYRATKAPPKRNESVAESDVSFGWVDDVDFGRTRKESPTGISSDLGKSRRGELKDWTNLEATYHEPRDNYSSRATYDNNMLRTKPPLGNTRKNDGLSRKPPPGPSGPRSPREKKPVEPRLYRETLVSRDSHESRQQSWGDWQHMALSNPGENGEGWGTIFRGMQLRWSDRQQRKKAMPPGSLTIEDNRSRDGSSRSDSIMDEETLKKRRIRVLMALAILALIVVLGVAVIIPTVILVSHDDKEPVSQPFTTFTYQVTSTPDLTFQTEMNDSTSSIFIETAKEFCTGIEERFIASDSSDKYRGCEVTELRNGSVMFVFILTVSGTDVTEAQVNGVITASSENGTFVLGTITLNLQSLTFVTFQLASAVTFTNVYCLAVAAPTNGNITYSGNQYSDTATVTCNTGYALQGESTINCTQRYTWTTLPNCTRVICVNYTVPENSTVTPTQLHNQEYNATLSITCAEGFTIIGNVTVSCMADGNWSASPTCNIRSCPNITLPTNGQINPSGPPLTYTSAYSVSCDEGYLLSEDVNVTCLSNGTWSNQPSCDPVACVGFTIPENSIISPSSTTGYVFTETINVTCDPGYEIVGNNTVTCMSNGGWSVSPMCQIINCPDVSIPTNSQLVPQTPDTVFGTSFEVICDEGYELQGNGNVECLANGTWSTSPTCNIVICTDFPGIENGNTNPAVTSGLQYNSTIDVICNDGYELSINDSIICQSNKSWSVVPSCDPITCIDYAIPANASVKGDGTVSGNVYLDVLSIECDNGFNIEGETEVSCQANGTWTASPNCKIVICEAYTIPDNSEIEHSGTSDHPFGTIITVNCMEGYELNGNDEVECQGDGKWTESPECKIIVCSNFTSPVNGMTEPQETSELTFNSSVTVACNGGYTLKGERLVRCLANKTWSNDPTCDPIDCEVFMYPNNSVQSDSVISENSTKFKEEITVTCKDGFVLIGQKTFSCNETGQWPNIVCEKVDCDEDEIEKPRLSIATVVNDVYTMECESGYNLEGNETVSCVQGNWTAIPNCTIVNCGNLDDPSNGTVTHNATTFGSLADLVCDDGFEGDTEFECLASGNWSGIPLCNPVICHEFVIINGSISSSWSSPYVFTNEITVECDEGFDVNGDTTLSCQADRDWSSKTTCEPIECGDTIDIDNSVLSPNITGKLKFGEGVAVDCLPGFEVNGSSLIQCQANKTLSKTPTCDRIRCPVLEFPEHSAINGIPETLFEEEVTLACNAGYKLIGESSSVCQANKTWSPFGTCEPIECENISLPEDLVTVEYSSMELIGVLFGENVEVNCQNEKLLVGDNQLSCNSNGNWTLNSECRQTDCNISSFIKPENSRVVDANNTFLRLECDSGYNISSFEIVGCTNGSWGLSPNCTPVDCGELEDPSNGAITSTGQTFLQTANLICEEGYEAESSDFFVCMASGSWNGTAACSIINCEELLTPENGFIVHNNTNRTFGASVQIACNIGYNLTEAGTIMCQADKSWSGDPKCEIIECSGDPVIENGNVDFSGVGREFKAEINITCNAGYEIELNSRVTCEGNGSWSGIKACEKVNCSILDIPDKATDIEITDTLFGAKYNISCEMGYELNGDSLIECTAAGHWSAIPTCEPVDCGDFTIPENGRVTNNNGNIFNETVTFECLLGHILNGSSVITCLADASWTKGPDCEIVNCGPLSVIPNGYYDDDVKTTFNETVPIECDVGYEFVDETTTTCQANGNWTKLPQCVKVKCPNYTAPENGLIENNVTSNEFGDIVQIGCVNGYNISSNGTLICQADRTWSGDPECNIITCNTDPMIADGSVDLGNSENRKFNSSVLIDCDEGYEIEKTASVTCDASGAWIGVKNCSLVDCGQFNETIANGTISNSTGTSYDDKVYFECDSGFILVGSNPIDCQQNGSWKEAPFCQEIDCVDPNITSSSYQKINATFYVVTCDDGHVLRGDQLIECKNEGWANLPTCEEVSCGNYTLDIINGQITEVTGILYGDEITFACNEGFIMNGTDVITCNENGDWGQPPICEPVDCGAPEDPENGQLLDYSPTIYNTTLIVECNEGFKLDGEPEISCLKSGNWSQGTVCSAINCDQLNVGGVYKNLAFTDGSNYGSVATVECEDGYKLIGNSSVNCTADGWSGFMICSNIGNVTFDKSQYFFNAESTGLLSCTIENAENWTTVLIQAPSSEEPIATINRTAGVASNSTSSDRYRFTDNVQLSQSAALLEVEISPVQCNDSGVYICGVIVTLGETQDLNFGQAQVTVLAAEAEEPSLTYDPPYTVTCKGVLGVNESDHVVDTLQLLARKQGESSFVVLVHEADNVTSGECRNIGFLNFTFPTNESWDQAEVKCVTQTGTGTLESDVIQLDYPAATCGDVPEIEFGSTVNVTSGDEVVLMVECDPGHENLGDVNITCTSSGWMGSPNCSFINCGELMNGSYFLFEPTNTSTTTYGSVIYGFCEDGYLPQQIFGSDNYAICEDTGEWNKSFSCEIVSCGNFTDLPAEGNITFTNGTTYNSVVEFECNEGFSLTGNSSVYICNSSQLWVPFGGSVGDPGPSCTVIGGLALDSDSYTTNVGGTFTITCALTNTLDWSTIALYQETEEDSPPLAQVNQTSPGVFDETPSEGVDILDSSTFSSNSATFSVRINNATCDSDGEYFCGAIRGNISDPTDSNSLTVSATVTVASDAEQPTLDSFNNNLNPNDIVTVTCRGNVGQQTDGEPVGKINVQILLNDDSSFQTLTNDVEPNVTKNGCLVEHVKSVNVTVDSNYDGAVVRCINEGDGNVFTSDNVTLNVTSGSQTAFQLQSVSEDGIYVDEMADSSSSVFTETEQNFCDGVLSELEQSYPGSTCNLVALGPGSLVITFRLTFPSLTVITEAGLITALTVNADGSGEVQIGNYSVTASSIQVTAVTITQGQASVLFGSSDPTFTIGEESSLNINIQGAADWNIISIYHTRDGVRTSFANITESDSQFSVDNVGLSADSVFSTDGAQVTIDFNPVQCEVDGSYDLELGLDGGGTIDVTAEVETEYTPKVKLTMPVEMREDFWALAIACAASFHEDGASEITWLMKRNDESVFTTFDPAEIVEKDVEFRDHNMTTKDGLPCIQEVKQDFDLNTTDSTTWNNTELRCALAYGTSNEILSDIGVLRIVPRSVCDNVEEGESVPNPLECAKRVECRDDSVEWSYVHQTECEEGTCWVGPGDSNCLATTTTTTTTTTTPAPGTPYISCMDTSYYAEQGDSVTYSCELRDIDSVTMLNITRNDMEMYNQEDENNGISGTINVAEGVTISIGEGYLNMSVETNCDTEGDYTIDVNNVTGVDLSLNLVAEPDNPSLSLPAILYLNQKTEITCNGNVGRDEDGKGKADLALEIRMPESATFEPLRGDIDEESTNTSCVITSVVSASVYFTEEFNRSTVRCVAKTDEIDIPSESKNVTLAQPSIYFAEFSISRYIGESLTLDCNVKNTLNVERVRMLKDNVEVAAVEADGTTSNQQDVEVLESSSVASGTSRLAIKFPSSLCSSRGDYSCEAITSNNITISTKTSVSMKRQPSTPTLSPSLQIIEGVSPWAGFETKCTTEVGYPAGTLSLETDSDGGVFKEINTTNIEYSVDDETCSTIATLEYINTYDMSWDDTTMKCIAKNEAIEDGEVTVEISKSINVVPASICDGKDPNTELPHPYYCYGRLTCTETIIAPYHLCNNNNSLCYDWDAQTCIDCEATNECDIGSTVAPTNPPGTPILNCTTEVEGRKNEIVTIRCDVFNINITLNDLTSTRKVTISNSNGESILDTTSATAGSTTDDERVFVEGPVEARITFDSIEIDTNLTDCNTAGPYSIQYDGDTALQDVTMIVITADAATPTYSQSPITLYEGQSVTIECQGNTGGPSDAAGSLTLVVQQPGSSDWTVQEGGVTETSNDESTCGTIATLTNNIDVTTAINGSKFACEITTSDGQTLRSSEKDVFVNEPVLEFGQDEVVEIGDNLTIECTWDISIATASANIRRRYSASGSEETVVSYTPDSGVTDHLTGISGQFQPADQTLPNTLSITFSVVECDDEAEYVCDLIVDGDKISEEKKDISVTRPPDIPELTLPSTLIIGQPTGYTDYLSCNGMVGYPTKQLQIVYTKPTEQTESEFTLGTKSVDSTDYENCTSELSVSYRTITFDSSWNNTVFKCVVQDSENVATQPQTLQILENNCSADNNGQYFLHPFDCHSYYWCHSVGTLTVYPCGSGCPAIVNGVWQSCTGSCDHCPS